MRVWRSSGRCIGDVYYLTSGIRMTGLERNMGWYCGHGFKVMAQGCGACPIFKRGDLGWEDGSTGKLSTVQA